MIHRRVLSVCALAIALQQSVEAASLSFVPVSARATNLVRFETLVGDVYIELYGAAGDSPAHVINFLQYVEDGEYDQSIAHRVTPPGGSFSIVQGGGFRLTTQDESFNVSNVVSIPTRGSVPNEFNVLNGLSNGLGTLGAARSFDRDSANSQWFVNTEDNSSAFDPGPYTVFGYVVDGLDVMQRISRMHTASPGAVAGSPFAGAFSEMPMTADGRFAVIRSITEVTIRDADFDDDGDVDALDYTTWIDGFGIKTGATSGKGDADRDGDVDGDDFLIWQSNFQLSLATSGGSASFVPMSSIASVPEPSTCVLLLTGLVAAVGFARKRR